MGGKWVAEYNTKVLNETKLSIMTDTDERNVHAARRVNTTIVRGAQAGVGANLCQAKLVFWLNFEKFSQYFRQHHCSCTVLQLIQFTVCLISGSG